MLKHEERLIKEVLRWYDAEIHDTVSEWRLVEACAAYEEAVVKDMAKDIKKKASKIKQRSTKKYVQSR